MSSPRLCSDGAPQTAHDIRENWAAGASNAGDSFSLGLYPTRATRVPLFTTWDSVAGSGRAPIPGKISGRSRPRNNTQCFRSAVGGPPGQRWILERGLRVGALLAHAGGVLYGTELGSVTLKRVGLFCSPTKHSTHTRVGSVADLGTQ